MISIQEAIDFKSKHKDYHQYKQYVYDIGVLMQAKNIVELGVRSGESTRTLVAIAHQTNGHVWAFDPHKMSHPFEDERLTFIQKKGEECLSNMPVEIDLLHIDTDPHTYGQTIMWLKLLARKIRKGGVILLHDTVAVSMHTRLREAILYWLKLNANAIEGYDRASYREYMPLNEVFKYNVGGMGIIVRWRIE